jgi:hypothetical protein
MANPTFKSKVDLWLIPLLAMPPIAAVATLISTYQASEGVLIGWISVIAVALMYVGLVYPVEYIMTPEALVIRFGLVRSKVEYESLEGVRPTRNPLSSPALSLDRLHLECGRSLGPYISPADKDGFLTALLERAPQLERDGDGLKKSG